MNNTYPWFEQNFQFLAQSYQANRLPHGLLVAAADGCGKQDFATHLAKSLLCEGSRRELRGACGQCKSCHLFAAGSHPDFYRVERLTDNKGKQKQSIGIDQIRQLNAKLMDTAQLSGWRVTIVESVSAMTTASFNALLKTLEEPGDNTLLMLLSDNIQRVPATIRSRCQIVQPDLTGTELTDWICAQTNAESSVAELALKRCFNAPIKARQFIEKNLMAFETDFFERCDRVLLNQMTPQELVSSTEGDSDEVWLLLASYFHQVQISIFNHSGIEQYRQVPAKLPFQLYSMILDYKRARFAGSNLQPNLQLQSVLIQWYEIGRKINYYSNR